MTTTNTNNQNTFSNSDSDTESDDYQGNESSFVNIEDFKKVWINDNSNDPNTANNEQLMKYHYNVNEAMLRIANNIQSNNDTQKYYENFVRSDSKLMEIIYNSETKSNTKTETKSNTKTGTEIEAKSSEKNTDGYIKMEFVSKLKTHSIIMEIDPLHNEALINTMNIGNHSPVELTLLLKEISQSLDKINIKYVIQQVTHDDWNYSLKSNKLFEFVNENKKYGFINVRIKLDKFPEAVMKALGFSDIKPNYDQ